MKKINFQTILSMKLEVYNYKFDRIGPFRLKFEFVRHISIAKNLSSAHENGSGRRWARNAFCEWIHE